MLRFRICILLLVFSAAVAFAQSPVVLISIDGMRPDYITTHACPNAFPTLQGFLTEGTYAEGVIGVLPTITYPSHTTLITGVEPARHGIWGNTTFDPESTNQSGWYWYAEDIKADTLWDAAARKGLVTASVGWPVTRRPAQHPLQHSRVLASLERGRPQAVACAFHPGVVRRGGTAASLHSTVGRRIPGT